MSPKPAEIIYFFTEKVFVALYRCPANFTLVLELNYTVSYFLELREAMILCLQRADEVTVFLYCTCNEEKKSVPVERCPPIQRQIRYFVKYKINKTILDTYIQKVTVIFTIKQCFNLNQILRKTMQQYVQK